MKFDDLLLLTADQPCFDFATLVQLTGESREQLRTMLHRWRKAGKIIPLRRGMYAVADLYRQREINPAWLSNWLYTPSYISLEWALSFYGMIPEKVVTYTAVSSRVPRVFENQFGRYSYSCIKQDAFFGYHPVSFGEMSVMLATPEKALLDLWHFNRAEWTLERMQEMRFQTSVIWGN